MDRTKPPQEDKQEDVLLQAHDGKQNANPLEPILDTLLIMEGNNSVEWALLQYLAWLDPKFIPKDLLLALVGNDQDGLLEAIESLERLSLVKVINKGKIRWLTMNSEIQDQVVNYAKSNPQVSKEITQLLVGMLELLGGIFPKITDRPDEKWEVARAYVPTIEALILHSIKREMPIPENKELALLNAKLGLFYCKVFHSDTTESLRIGDLAYQDLRAISNELDYYGRDLVVRQPLYPGNCPNVAASLNKLGVLYRKLGNVMNSLGYHQSALVMRYVLYQGCHHDVAASLNNVGIAYEEFGDVRKGLDYKKLSLKMRRYLYPGGHSDVARSLSNVGIAYDKLGDVRKSLDYKEQALKMMQDFYKDDHHDVAAFLNNVGIAYEKLGDIRKGLDYKERALKMRQALYKGNNIDVAQSLNNVGIAYEKLGDTIKGLDYKEQALNMMHALYGSAHPNIAASFNNIGVAYEKLGDIRKGLEYYKLALTMRQILYQGNHPEVAASLNNIGNAHYRLGDFTKSLAFHTSALMVRQAVYQGCHSDIADSLSNVGIAYHALVDVINGLKYYEQALSMRQTLYQGDHLAVASSLNDVSIAYYALGDISNGLKYKKLAITMNQALTQKQEEFKGQGTLSYTINNCFEYYNNGLDQILGLRLDGIGYNTKAVVLKSLCFGEELSSAVQKLTYDVGAILSDGNVKTVLAPVNLYNKHWLGLLFKGLGARVEVTYMDSEQGMMLPELKEGIEHSFAMNGYKSWFLEARLERQRYNNCGLEVIENFIYYLTGTRATQEGSVWLHSLLVENSLLNPNEYGLKLEENNRLIGLLANAQAVEIVEVPLLIRTSVRMRGVESLCKKLLYRQELKKFSGMIGEYGIELPDKLNTFDVLLDNSKFNKVVMNRIHPDKNPFGADIAHEDTLFVRDLRHKLAADLKLEELLDDSLVKINSMLHKSSIGFKALDIVVDSARLAYEPNMMQVKKLALDCAHLHGLMVGVNAYTLGISGAEATYQLHMGEYQKAFDVATGCLSAMALPVILAHVNRPYLGFAYSLFVAATTAYNAIENAYSFALELASGEELQALSFEFMAGQVVGDENNSL